ncbi:hypothetical protein KQY30_35135 [Streptomyces sp. GMY02]|uniref:hypothetical protein n=1 Tax=Streptomyces sp. GMY02 TaxID=1333528 RepID=UPI001C2BB7F3|nr:hypothetical protein [Streptomyces sp. GMY02]QXE38681.1 hypothetical protein KQY30_35135 [Streptomyces sp. GMY02]
MRRRTPIRPTRARTSRISLFVLGVLDGVRVQEWTQALAGAAVAPGTPSRIAAAPRTAGSIRRGGATSWYAASARRLPSAAISRVRTGPAGATAVHSATSAPIAVPRRTGSYRSEVSHS